ncbi:MAG: hypothetical protein JSR59_00060 [Proteobacteria bacterium]|nr:hypothetical protein [Pseudomonadota bacterium]
MADTTALVHDVAERALAQMRAIGFEHAQVGASRRAQEEINIAHNEAALLRSTETEKLSLAGIVDGRMASTEVGRFDEAGPAIEALYASARVAPQDDAYAVSSGQRADIVQGPQSADVDVVAAAVEQLLAYRAQSTPRMMLDESLVAHSHVTSRTLTSGGSDLRCRLGSYGISVFGTAREGGRSSSFNFASGSSNDLRAHPAHRHFGIGEMLHDTERQIDTVPYGSRGTGDVVLAPRAVADLLGWLMSQLADQALIGGSSLYRDKVGSAIASPLLRLKSRFDAPGVAALSADAFNAAPIEILRDGLLMTLTPTLYGSRKTGLAHVPIAASGWEIAAGATPLADMLAGVERGALVGRLSMGRPAANGDFSSVVKNSFRIDGGAVGPALAETMIGGNVAQMLLGVSAVSRERIDSGGLLLPWLRIGGLHFS